MDSYDTSVTGTQGGSSSIMTKKNHVGNIKPVPRSVVSNTQELRTTLPNQIHSPSLMWLYHSNWSDDLSPPTHHNTTPFNSYQSQLELGHLETANSRTEAPLFVPEMPSSDIPNRKPIPVGFERGRDRGVWTLK